MLHVCNNCSVYWVTMKRDFIDAEWEWLKYVCAVATLSSPHPISVFRREKKQCCKARSFFVLLSTQLAFLRAVLILAFETSLTVSLTCFTWIRVRQNSLLSFSTPSAKVDSKTCGLDFGLKTASEATSNLRWPMSKDGPSGPNDATACPEHTNEQILHFSVNRFSDVVLIQ